MSRSKHTRPDQILAAERLRAPRTSRGKDDPSAFHQVARKLKEAGVVLEMELDTRLEAAPLPRIITKRARKGFSHPMLQSDVLSVLQFFGERCFYGLRTIKLLNSSGSEGEGKLSFGRLEVPGTIVIYEQPNSPWFINGVVPETDRTKLVQAGAIVEAAQDQLHSLVHWTADDLKMFMLFEVLMHEIGHHLIQQYKGKRGARVARTKDHERFAELFAQKCRASYSMRNQVS